MQDDVLIRNGAGVADAAPATPEEGVLAEMKKSDATIAKVARLLHLSPAEVKDCLKQAKARLMPEGKERFVVSARHMFEPWPPSDFGKIEQAKRDFDAGKIEMATAYAGDFRYLLAIPRKQRADERDWFGGVL